MFVPTTFAAALIMTVLSTICWGSFANTFKGTRNYRFEPVATRGQSHCDRRPESASTNH